MGPSLSEPLPHFLTHFVEPLRFRDIIDALRGHDLAPRATRSGALGGVKRLAPGFHGLNKARHLRHAAWPDSAHELASAYERSTQRIDPHDQGRVPCTTGSPTSSHPAGVRTTALPTGRSITAVSAS
jgi:hypothetical protein